MDDLISRQAVIDELNDWKDHGMTQAEEWHLRQVIGSIRSLPSEKKRWILRQRFVGDETPDMECPVCGYIMKWGTRVVCPNCLSHVVLHLESDLK